MASRSNDSMSAAVSYRRLSWYVLFSLGDMVGLYVPFSGTGQPSPSSEDGEDTVAGNVEVSTE